MHKYLLTSVCRPVPKVTGSSLWLSICGVEREMGKIKKKVRNIWEMGKIWKRNGKDLREKKKFFGNGKDLWEKEKLKNVEEKE